MVVQMLQRDQVGLSIAVSYVKTCLISCIEVSGLSQQLPGSRNLAPPVKSLKRKGPPPSALGTSNKRPRFVPAGMPNPGTEIQEPEVHRRELESRRYDLEARRVNYLENLLSTAESPAPTLGATTLTAGAAQPKLRTVACDIWYFTASTDNEHAPAGVDLEAVKALDVAYQASKHFKTFRHPGSKRLRCILCL